MAGETFTIVEPLDQGLVTSRDQALLLPGELAKADGCVYRPNDPSIQKGKGRTKFNAAAIAGTPSVQGLRYLAFDDVDSVLVAHAGTDYFVSTMEASETGTFSTLAAAVGTGATLDAVQYGNKHYLFNGQGTTNVVVKSDLTTRNHGLFPVADPPTVASTTGSWNSVLGAGYYFFMTVEIVNPGTIDEIESTNMVPDAQMPSFQFTTTNLSTVSLTITKPTTVNSSATHWQVYMAGPYTNATPVAPRSSFRRVGSPVDIGSTTTTIGNFALPGTNNKFPSANTIVSGGGWTNPNNAHANDNVGATATTTGQDTLWHTFGFSGITGTIQGVEVHVKASLGGFASNGRPFLRMFLTSDAGGAYTSPQTIQMWSQSIGTGIFERYSPGQFSVFTYGGPNNLWGRTWVTTDFNANANFGVRLGYLGTGSTQISVDYIRVLVYTVGTSAGTQVSMGTFFPTIAISVAGLTSVIGSHGPPPIATTAEVFEDQLVMNNITDPSKIHYSLPTQPDYVPALYFINFETKQTDEVTLVKRLGDKLLTGMKTQVFRVNYLPREGDAEFDRGRCYETISEGQGIVGNQAATTFTTPGGPLLMAFVSYSGLHVTDGFQTDTVSDDLDWENTVSIPTAASPTDYLKNCILVDYPLQYWLLLYYTPTGATSNTKALVFHYHPSHRKPNGKFKITGPITVSALSATIGRVSNSPALLTGQSGGFVYVEDRGFTHNAGGTLAIDVRSREMYPWGMTETGVVSDWQIRHNQDATSTVTVTPLVREADGAQATPTLYASGETFTTANAGVASIPFHLYADSVQWKMTEPGADAGAGVRLGAMMIEATSAGGSE